MLIVAVLHITFTVGERDAVQEGRKKRGKDIFSHLSSFLLRN